MKDVTPINILNSESDDNVIAEGLSLDDLSVRPMDDKDRVIAELFRQIHEKDEMIHKLSSQVKELTTPKCKDEL